jgi:predicted lipid-binding transport protein (Tim44 family)
MLLGAQQQQQPNAGNLLGSLLGGQQAAQAQQPAAGGMLGSLLGGLTGGNTSGGGLADGIDANDLLTAGMAFMQAKQTGDSNAEALLDAVVAASAAGQSAHRAQSGKLVASSLLQAFSGLKK